MLKNVFLFSLVMNIALFSNQEVWNFITNLKASKRDFIYRLFNGISKKKNDYQSDAQLLVVNKFDASKERYKERYTDLACRITEQGQFSEDTIKKFFQEKSFFYGVKCLFITCNGIEEEKTRQQTAMFMLEENGSLIHAVYYKNKKTLLHIAADKGDTEMIKLLIQRGAKVNERDDKGCTSLHYLVQYVPFAAEKGRAVIHSCIEFLVKFGADVDQKDNEGKTPIFYAIENGPSSYIHELIRQRASLTITNNQNQTPIEYAKMLAQKNPKKYSHIVSILENKKV